VKSKVLILVTAALLALVACKKKGNTKVVDPGDDQGSADRTNGRGDLRTGATDTGNGDDGATKVSGDDGESMPQFAAIYFEFDSATLTKPSRAELQQLGEWLNAHPKAHITIQGHTDERGTDEYNVALGERRAATIKEYLSRLGVDNDRLETISYGEERPAASGDDEDAYAQNRRGELVQER